jgi:hypothetical protein
MKWPSLITRNGNEKDCYTVCQGGIVALIIATITAKCSRIGYWFQRKCENKYLRDEILSVVKSRPHFCRNSSRASRPLGSPIADPPISHFTTFFFRPGLFFLVVVVVLAAFSFVSISRFTPKINLTSGQGFSLVSLATVLTDGAASIVCEFDVSSEL